MIPPSIFLAIPIMAILTILQTAVLPYFPIFGAVPSLPFLVALSWALLRGPNEGAIWAFIAGFFMDLFTTAPVGGQALTYTITVFAVGIVNDYLPENRLVVPMIFAAVATLGQWIMYAIYLSIFGYNTFSTFSISLLPSVVLQTFLILPIYWLLYLIQRTLWPKPVEI